MFFSTAAIDLDSIVQCPWGRRNRDRIGGGGKSAGGREITKLVVEDGEAVSVETELRRLGGGIWRLSVRGREKIRPNRYNGNLVYYVF
jgi:hypothetical protein